MRPATRVHTIVSSTLLAVAAVGCKPSSDGGLRSFFGLEAGQDADVRAKVGDSLFVDLAAWFAAFKLQTAESSGARGEISVSTVRSKFPKAYVNTLLAYLNVQGRRIDKLSAALARNDDATVKRLLDKETLEMRDIALILIHPGVKESMLKTKDKLALLLVRTRAKEDFVDQFALNGFLDKAFATGMTTQQLVDALEPQRQRYLAALVERYLGSAEGRQAFNAQLRASRASVTTLAQQLRGATGLQLADTTQATQNGTIGTLSTFLKEVGDKGKQKFTTGNAMTADGIIDPLAGKNSPGATKDNASGGKDNPKTVGDNGINVPKGFAPISGQATPAPPSSAAPSTPSPSKPSPSPSKPAPQPQVAPSRPAAPPLPGTPPLPESPAIPPSDPYPTDLVAGLDSSDDDESYGLTNASNTPIPRVAAPLLDPAKYNLSSAGLVGFHRNAGFAVLRRPPTTAAPNSSSELSPADGTGGPDISCSEIAQFKTIPGSAESGGDVTQQGSVGSCAWQTARYVWEVIARENGIDTSKQTPRTGDEISATFNERGGEAVNANLEAAYAFAAELAREKGIELSKATVDWAGARACLCAGHPVLMGLYINVDDWSRRGGGKEFPGGKGGEDKRVESDVTCSPNSDAGHAILPIEVLKDNKIRIKNSWGSLWNGDGTAILDAQCVDAFFGYCVTGKKL